ncbi:MAG: S-methyl-5-thioribose kinase [Fusobacteria bacterium]|nr:S-methyl-5-thioribose kinase [Fusobacteriota bacterium]
MDKYVLTVENCAKYCESKGFFKSSKDKVEVEEIGDGNLNFVFRVKTELESIIVKQAPPYLKVVGNAWPLTVDRIRIEAESLELQNIYAPGKVPNILLKDLEMAVMILEDLAPMRVVRYEMLNGIEFPTLAKDVGEFLAAMGFYSSDFYLPGKEKRELVKKFSNPELCKITEELIFTDPYYDAKSNVINSELRTYLEKEFWTDEALKVEVTKLKYLFLTSTESLLHGDLHTGSLFGNRERCVVFDTEFSFYGPTAFDIGKLIGNLIINNYSWEGVDFDGKDDYQRYLKILIRELWECFSQNFIKLVKLKSTQKIMGDEFLNFYLQELFSNMLGFAGTTMVRRMHGLAHNRDIERIEDLKLRAKIQEKILRKARYMIVNRKLLESIQNLIELI